ncbi:hypothetical protein CBR_g49186 [Chara braunii]|uniref:Tyr recombinase domain-containing protein n=1 Tax=Chara braunii TaxID=69332 RepID=A0A388M4G6_CHABU|nr:hypothetical protein CBR_g49186 [Chara braunii]|eukprot:GBG89395.1 hypothetical protein CBR_g49186 [Chara braunii]
MIRLRDPEVEEETFLGWLPELVNSYDRLGQDVKRGHLFWSMRGDGPVSGGGFNKRIEKWFEEAGVYEGESGHNFRIGGVQAGIEEGWSLEEMMQQGTWSIVRTFMRYGYGMRRGWKRRSEGVLADEENCCETEDYKVRGSVVNCGATEAGECGFRDGEAVGDVE